MQSLKSSGRESFRYQPRPMTNESKAAVKLRVAICFCLEEGNRQRNEATLIELDAKIKKRVKIV
jgi:hypothetical protein